MREGERMRCNGHAAVTMGRRRGKIECGRGLVYFSRAGYVLWVPCAGVRRDWVGCVGQQTPAEWDDEMRCFWRIGGARNGSKGTMSECGWQARSLQLLWHAGASVVSGGRGVVVVFGGLGFGPYGGDTGV